MGMLQVPSKPRSEERERERKKQEKRPVFLFNNSENNDNKNYFNEINKIITDFDLKNKLVALLKLEFTEKKDFTKNQEEMNEILMSYKKICHNGHDLKSQDCQFWADEIDKVKTWEGAEKDIKTVTEIKEAVVNRADFKFNKFSRMYTVTLKEQDTAAVGGKKRKSLKKRRKSKKKSKRKSLKKKRKTRRR